MDDEAEVRAKRQRLIAALGRVTRRLGAPSAVRSADAECGVQTRRPERGAECKRMVRSLDWVPMCVAGCKLALLLVSIECTRVLASAVVAPGKGDDLAIVCICTG